MMAPQDLCLSFIQDLRRFLEVVEWHQAPSGFLSEPGRDLLELHLQLAL